MIKMNDHQKLRFGKQIVETMFNTINSKKIAVLGFAFKAGLCSSSLFALASSAVTGAEVGLRGRHGRHAGVAGHRHLRHAARRERQRAAPSRAAACAEA